MTTAREVAGPAVLPLPPKIEVLAATDRAVRRLVADLSSLPADAWSRPACGSWNVDETVAHLSLGPIAYAVIIEQMAEGGQDELFDVTDPEFAESQNDLIGTAEPQERIDAVVGAFHQFSEAAFDIPEEQLTELTWTPEAIMPVAAGLGIALNELVVHGYEVRTATGLDPLPVEGNPAALAAFTIYAFTGLVRDGGWPPIELAVGGALPVTVAWNGERTELHAVPHSETAARIECGAGVLALLLWGRLSLTEARQRFDVIVTGDADAAERLFATAKAF